LKACVLLKERLSTKRLYSKNVLALKGSHTDPQQPALLKEHKSLQAWRFGRKSVDMNFIIGVNL